jgi:hypothetical protein
MNELIPLCLLFDLTWTHNSRLKADDPSQGFTRLSLVASFSSVSFLKLRNEEFSVSALFSWYKLNSRALRMNSRALRMNSRASRAVGIVHRKCPSGF